MSIERLDSKIAPSTISATLREFLCHPSPWVLIVGIAGTFVARMCLARPFDWIDLVVMCATLASWPIIEWAYHHGILHTSPFVIRDRTIDFSVHHRDHHADPVRTDRVLMEPVGLGITMIIIIVLLVVLSPSAALGCVAASAFLTASLNYEWTLFVVHTPYGPHGIYRRLWRHHQLHHFKNEHHWFGVSSRIVDSLVGSNPPVESTPTSKTARTLGDGRVSGVDSEV